MNTKKNTNMELSENTNGTETKSDLKPLLGKGRKLRVLNLYAGIGGNRKLWRGVDVTAVEKNEKVAQVYADQFPEDELIIGDAHEYLLNNYKEFDFIWSSPPCQTNSKVFEAGIKADRYSDKVTVKYHDLSLYQEVLFLQRYYDGHFVVENVEPFYKPLIPAEKVDRHLFWASFRIGKFEPKRKKKSHMESEDDYLAEFFGYDLDDYFKDKTTRRQVLRNCVHPETGLHILSRVVEIITKTPRKQVGLFA
jgi:DNA (cytosine-5)-methyltransferase 1